MFFSHQGRKSHLFLISNDTTQYAQSEIKQRKERGFLLPKGIDVIYTHFWNIFKNGLKCWNNFSIHQNLQGRCFRGLSRYCHWDMAYAVLAESVWLLANYNPECSRVFMCLIKRKWENCLWRGDTSLEMLLGTSAV